MLSQEACQRHSGFKGFIRKDAFALVALSKGGICPKQEPAHLRAVDSAPPVGLKLGPTPFADYLLPMHYSCPPKLRNRRKVRPKLIGVGGFGRTTDSKGFEGQRIQDGSQGRSFRRRQVTDFPAFAVDTYGVRVPLVIRLPHEQVVASAVLAKASFGDPIPCPDYANATRRNRSQV
jgi:hypothetical protein